MLICLKIRSANLLIIRNQRIESKMKQNRQREANTSRSSHHPSQQTKQNPYRSSIKVGYKVIPHLVEQKRAKKRIQPAYKLSQKANCRKLIEDVKAQICGKFVGAQYIKESQKQAPMFQKKGVSECRNKNQGSQAIKQRISSQFSSLNKSKNSRRSTSVTNISVSHQSIKNPLPSYQQTGIKDIMEYHHALKYRQVPITQKCTSSTALSRFCKFTDLHQYDFRKKPEFFR